MFIFLLITELGSSELYNTTLLKITKKVLLPNDADIYYQTPPSPKVPLKGVRTDVLETVSGIRKYAAVIDNKKFIRAIHLGNNIILIDPTNVKVGNARFPTMTQEEKIKFKISFDKQIA